MYIILPYQPYYEPHPKAQKPVTKFRCFCHISTFKQILEHSMAVLLTLATVLLLYYVTLSQSSLSAQYSIELTSSKHNMPCSSHYPARLLCYGNFSTEANMLVLYWVVDHIQTLHLSLYSSAPCINGDKPHSNLHQHDESRWSLEIRFPLLFSFFTSSLLSLFLQFVSKQTKLIIRQHLQCRQANCKYNSLNL